MRHKIALFALSWIAVVMLSFGWEYYNARENEAQSILDISRAFFKQIVLTREWNAQHGGVYVYADEETPPNPFLKDAMRDITLENGDMLTKVNPAYMTRQLSELAAEAGGTQIHITSLNPIRPQNAPFEWERAPLESFHKGTAEYGEFFDGHYRYMAPLITTESCLKCHASQGYKVGEIRGGISITLPYDRYVTIGPIAVGYTLVALIGLLLIFVFGNRLARAYEMLKEQSIIDPLTGIPNRRFFMKRVKEEFLRAQRSGKPLAFLIADVDYFKLFNDRYGHLEGDSCLHQIAETMKRQLHRPPDIIARYGGEEFVILLPETPQEGAEKIAEKLRAAVEALHINNEASACSHVVTVSLGVTAAHAGDITYESLFKTADAALYRAKQSGRNRVETLPAS